MGWLVSCFLLGDKRRLRCQVREDVVFELEHVPFLAFFLVFAKFFSNIEDCEAGLALPLRPQDADLPSLILVVLS